MTGARTGGVTGGVTGGRTGLATDAWVLVCDGSKALLLRNAGGPRDIRLDVIRKREIDNPPTAEQGSGPPGRQSDGPSGHKSIIKEPDWHDQAERRFARDLAGMLYADAHAGAYAQLVLVAAPAVLGDIRAALHDEVRARLLAEVPKTLTNHPVPEIEAALAEALAEALDGVQEPGR